MQAIQRIQAGENVPPPQNPTKEYLAYFSQFIKSPAFKQLDPEVQRIMLEHIRATVDAAKQGLGGQGEQGGATRTEWGYNRPSQRNSWR